MSDTLTADTVTDQPRAAAAPWWQRYPDRWAAEQAALDAAGIDWTIDEEIRDGGDVLLQVRIRAGSPITAGTLAAGTDLHLSVEYPSTFPWFPPAVSDPEGGLAWAVRHRAPTGTLCLIHPVDWHIEHTAAFLLTRQLPALLATAHPDALATLGRDSLATLEVALPEPAALYQRGTGMILVDSAWVIADEHKSGALLVEFGRNPAQAPQPGLAAAMAVYAGVGGPVATLDRGLRPRASVPVYGRWVRLDTAPDTTDPDALYQRIAALAPTIQLVPAPSAGSENPAGPAGPDAGEARRATAGNDQTPEGGTAGRVDIIGIYYPDEATWRGPTQWAWTFLLRTRKDRRHKWVTRLVRPGYAGADDLGLRTPTARDLRGKKALLVGVGALGSTIAVQIARGGVGRLTLIDSDFLDPGNLARHQGFLVHCGGLKIVAVRDLIRQTSPLTRVGYGYLHLGSTASEAGSGEPQHHVVTDLVATHDLVVDAAADPAVSRYLAALAAAQGKTYVHVSATAGAWGGTVITITPDADSGCWACLHHHRADNSLPVPPADPAGVQAVQPIGCGQATFTGAAADLDTIASHASRVITTLLCGQPTGDGADGGTQTESSAHVAALRDTAGQPAPVAWTATTINQHPDCPLHDSRPS